MKDFVQPGLMQHSLMVFDLYSYGSARKVVLRVNHFKISGGVKMDDCTHANAQANIEVCEHLLADQEDHDLTFWLRFTGVGSDYILVCPACVDLPNPTLIRVCNDCFDERDWNVFVVEGVQGIPEVLVRPSSLHFRHHEFEVSGLPDGTPAGLTPLTEGGNSTWLWLTNGGELMRVDLGQRCTSRVATIGSSDIDWAAPLRIHTSPDGRFAAVVNARGSRGIVIDLVRGKTTMQLNRATNGIEFPIAFFQDTQRTLLVHGTNGTRLDISDPSSGELLTKRWFYDRPFYRSNYTCGGRLTVSPDGRWLVDDGAGWKVAYPRTCDLHRWLYENPFESENGPSVRVLRETAYWGSSPCCFVDIRTLAIWGFGRDGDMMTAAAVLYDVPTGSQLRWFAGPPDGEFVFDRHLIVMAKNSTSVWDIATGERLLEDSNFTPLAYHPAAHRFLSLHGGVVVESALVDG